MATVKLTKKATEYLAVLMAELGLERTGGGKSNERPVALKIAFAKGIASDTLPKIPSDDEKKETKDFEFNTSVIAKDNELSLIRHLIIDKLKRKIVDDKDLDTCILLFIEHGLEIMYNEIQSLTNMDNYMIYLLEKHTVVK